VHHALLAVAAGAGIAVLPASAARRASIPGVRLIPLEGGPVCELALITRDETSTTVTGFVALASRCARTAARRERLTLVAA